MAHHSIDSGNFLMFHSQDFNGLFLRAFLWLAVVMGNMIVSLLPSVSYADPGKFVEGHILVQPRSGLPLKAFHRILHSQGGKSVDRIYGLDVHIVEVPPQAEEGMVQALSHHPHIKFAELDTIHELSVLPNDPNSYNSSTNTWPAWHLPKMEAPAAWDQFLNAGQGIGQGVTIAVLDTGCDGNHPDLGPKLIPGWNSASGNNDTSPVHGHGTQTAGVVGAASNNGIGVASIAWDSPIMPIRVTNDTSGSASTSAIASGITWAADHGARVASISYQLLNGSTLNTAAQYMRNQGGLVLVAAGNSGVDEGYNDNPYVISVAATDSGDNRTSWSNYGKYIDVAAPGAGIMTTIWGGGYGGVSGTSFSCPAAAAVVGLMMSANPGLTVDAVEGLLEGSAVDLGAPGWDIYYGHGRVNANGAVQMAMDGSSGGGGDTQNPTVSITSPSNNSTVIGLVNVNVSASDNIGVTKVVLFAGNIKVGEDLVEPYQFTWDSTQMADGSVALIAYAYDAANNEGSSGSHSVLVDNMPDNPGPTDTIPPTVTFGDNLAGTTVSGTVQIAVNATDNQEISLISLFIDEQLVSSTNTSPLTYNWNTRKVSAGAHLLTAVANDTAGNHAEAMATVTVGSGGSSGNGKGRTK